MLNRLVHFYLYCFDFEYDLYNNYNCLAGRPAFFFLKNQIKSIDLVKYLTIVVSIFSSWTGLFPP